MKARAHDLARPALSRRELLRGLALAGGATLAAAAGGSAGLLACAREDALEQGLRGLHRDAEAARAVGVLVLAEAPERPSASDLVARVARDRAAALRALARSDPARLAEELRAQHREDFAQGRVVVVRGWVLSETESALLALAALPAG